MPLIPLSSSATIRHPLIRVLRCLLIGPVLTGEFVSLQYEAEQMLMQVTDPQGRSLRRHHLDRQAVEDTHRVIDDFGRLLIIDSPDSGKQSAQYDAADRLIQTTDANGNQTRHAYNAAGQPTLRTTIGHDSSGAPQIDSTAYRYHGTRLVAATLYRALMQLPIKRFRPYPL